ncbi:MAG TPA: hypothetical protein VKX49_12505 [Bryobacteraceae bacterium]|nr:hypothetical protein [Bryobacteraceae bacterium]
MVLGAPPDYTISGEIGKHQATNPIAEEAGDVLDKIQKNHVEDAAAVDAALTETRKHTPGGGT